MGTGGTDLVRLDPRKDPQATDYEDYCPSFPINTDNLPSAGSIENEYRMGQVLLRRGDEAKAIEKFVGVCMQIEKAIGFNTAAESEIPQALLALRTLGEIYEKRQDWAKANAYYQALRELLEYIHERRRQRRLSGGDDDDDDDGRGLSLSVVSSGVRYRQIFEKVHAAIALPERHEESPEELAKRIEEAREKDREAEEERITLLMEQHVKRQRKLLKHSWWRRWLRRAVDHPVWFTVICVAITIGAILALRPGRPRRAAPARSHAHDEDFADPDAFLRRMEEQYGGAFGRGGGHDHDHDHGHGHHHDHGHGHHHDHGHHGEEI